MTMIPRSAHARASAPSHLPSNDDRPWAREGCATTGHPPAEAAEEEAVIEDDAELTLSKVEEMIVRPQALTLPLRLTSEPYL